MASPLPLSVEVQAVVVPVLQWGEDQYPIQELLRDRATAAQAGHLLRAMLRDLDHMQRHYADAADADRAREVLRAQVDDHAHHARLVREFLSAHPELSPT